MSNAADSKRPSLADLTTEQPESRDPDYLAWVERQIAEGQEQMKDQAKRIPAAKVWETFDLDH